MGFWWSLGVGNWKDSEIMGMGGVVCFYRDLTFGFLFIFFYSCVPLILEEFMKLKICLANTSLPFKGGVLRITI